MPEAYVKMRDKFKRDGMSSKGAKRKAAAIYNSKNPDDPVTRNYDDKHKRRKSKVRYPRPR